MNDGGPAFPRPSSEAVDGHGNHFFPSAETGMSLRDWFAGMALCGINSCDEAYVGLESKDAANLAYDQADAMIAERNK